MCSDLPLAIWSCAGWCCRTEHQVPPGNPYLSPQGGRLGASAIPSPMVRLRLVCSPFWVDVRLRETNGRWIASADTSDGPSSGPASER